MTDWQLLPIGCEIESKLKVMGQDPKIYIKQTVDHLSVSKLGKNRSMEPELIADDLSLSSGGGW